MSFEQVQTSVTYVKPAECTKGQVMAEGWYCTPLETKFGITHMIRTEHGGMIGVNSFGHLDYALKAIKEGDFIRITYDGKDVIKTGEWKNVAAHRCIVAIDRSRSGAVNNPNPSNEAIPSDDVAETELF